MLDRLLEGAIEKSPYAMIVAILAVVIYIHDTRVIAEANQRDLSDFKKEHAILVEDIGQIKIDVGIIKANQLKE